MEANGMFRAYGKSMMNGMASAVCMGENIGKCYYSL